MLGSRSTRALKLVLANVLVLALIECALRAAWTVRDDLRTYFSRSESKPASPTWFVDSPALGWERRPGFKGDFAGPREFDSAGFLAIDSLQVADATRRRKRVVFLGDSNTMGYGVAAESTFAEIVESRLSHVDAINLGVIGYSSYQGRKVLEAALPALKPDAIVVSFNFNDRRAVATPRDIDGEENFRRVGAARASQARRMVDRIDWSYTVRALRGLLTRLGAIARVPEPGEIRVDELMPRVDENAYRENLRAMATSAREAGATIVFLLLGDNPIQTHDLNRGVELLEERDYDLAIDYLRYTARSDWFRLLGRLYLAQAHEATGETRLANEALRIDSLSAKLHGQAPVRLDREYHAIMRAVAVEQQADVVDGVSFLNAHPEVFDDMCHFDAEGHRLIGEEVARLLARVLASDSPMEPPQRITDDSISTGQQETRR